MNLVLFIYRIFFLKDKGILVVSGYVKNVIRPILFVSILSLPIPILIHCMVSGLCGFCMTLFITVLITFLVILYIGMSSSERTKVIGFVINKIRRK